jgi:hypothetical protein
MSTHSNNTSTIVQTVKGPIMPEVSSRAAARIIGISDQTVRRHIHAGRLQARREGLGWAYWIELDELRRFTEKYNYRFNEELARELARN